MTALCQAAEASTGNSCCCVGWLLRLNHWVIDGDEFKRRFWEDRHYNPPVRKDIFFFLFLYRSGEGIRVSFNFFFIFCCSSSRQVCYFFDFCCLRFFVSIANLILHSSSLRSQALNWLIPTFVVKYFDYFDFLLLVL